MKKILFYFCTLLLILCLVGCSKSNHSVQNNQRDLSTLDLDNQLKDSSVSIKTDSDNILIAYFSRVGNTDFPDEVDAISSASLLIKDGAIFGNTQYIANLIQENIGGELFLIQSADKYPSDYDETEEQGRIENRDKTRPVSESHVKDLDDYDIVLLGFPNWYYDMPMAVYSFLEENDLSGKTIVPFCTSGGSGFSKSIPEIQELEPNATVITNGYTVTHSRVNNVTTADIGDWIAEIGLAR